MIKVDDSWKRSAKGILKELKVYPKGKATLHDLQDLLYHGNLTKKMWDTFTKTHNGVQLDVYVERAVKEMIDREEKQAKYNEEQRKIQRQQNEQRKEKAIKQQWEEWEKFKQEFEQEQNPFSLTKFTFYREGKTYLDYLDIIEKEDRIDLKRIKDKYYFMLDSAIRKLDVNDFPAEMSGSWNYGYDKFYHQIPRDVFKDRDLRKLLFAKFPPKETVQSPYSHIEDLVPDFKKDVENACYNGNKEALERAKNNLIEFGTDLYDAGVSIEDILDRLNINLVDKIHWDRNYFLEHFAVKDNPKQYEDFMKDALEKHAQQKQEREKQEEIKRLEQKRTKEEFNAEFRNLAEKIRKTTGSFDEETIRALEKVRNLMKSPYIDCSPQSLYFIVDSYEGDEDISNKDSIEGIKYNIKKYAERNEDLDNVEKALTHYSQVKTLGSKKLADLPDEVVLDEHFRGMIKSSIGDLVKQKVMQVAKEQGLTQDDEMDKVTEDLIKNGLAKKQEQFEQMIINAEQRKIQQNEQKVENYKTAAENAVMEV